MIQLLLMKLNDIYSLYREYLEMNGCPTMCCDVMYAVMDVSMWINAVFKVKSVVPICTIDNPTCIHMASICHTQYIANRDQISVW